MSHYDCILPVDFARLRDIVMPTWIEFIAGERDPRAFVGKFVPYQELWPDYDWLDVFDWPTRYIEWFRERGMPRWNADEMKREVGALLPDESAEWYCDELLVWVIKQSCAVELTPNRPFTKTTYWNRLHSPPYVQVAGTKNRCWLLSELYEWAWESGRHLYSIQRKGLVEDGAYSLLEALFFNSRVLLGGMVMPKSMI